MSMIVIFVFPKAEMSSATALANHYSDRVKVMGWERFSLDLIALIAEKTKKEEVYANPARG